MKFRLKSHILVEAHEGEAYILDLEQGFYFAADGASVEILQLLDREQSLEQITEALGTVYNIDSSVIQQDIKQHVEQLLEENLIECIS